MKCKSRAMRKDSFCPHLQWIAIHELQIIFNKSVYHRVAGFISDLGPGFKLLWYMQQIFWLESHAKAHCQGNGLLNCQSWVFMRVKYIQYLSHKCLINKALWSQWFEAGNASMPLTEGVLIKLFNIQLTKIKNMFCNYSVFFIWWSLFVQESGAVSYDVQMKQSSLTLILSPEAFVAVVTLGHKMQS